MFSDDFLGGERDPREDPHRIWEDPLGTTRVHWSTLEYARVHRSTLE